MSVIAKVTSKGQVTIPKSVRDALGISEGDKLIFRVEGDHAVVTRPPDFLSLAGSVRVPDELRGASWDEIKAATWRDRAKIRKLTLSSAHQRIDQAFDGDPPDMAERATGFLKSSDSLLLTDLIVAETMYVLLSYYDMNRPHVSEAIQSLLAFESVVCADRDLLIRALDIFDDYRIDFAEAYLAACAEVTGVGVVASFDRSIDRVPTVVRL